MHTNQREFREDARLILREFAQGRITEDHALNLLGFGEPLTGTIKAERGPVIVIGKLEQ